MNRRTRVVVGSTNPTKVGAVRAVFLKYWPDLEVVGRAVEIPASISEMPVGGQVREGARFRARSVMDETARFAVGAEGGVEFDAEEAYLLNWVAVLRFDGVLSEAPSAKLRLPPRLAQALRAGRVLGDLMVDKLGRPDVNEKEGAIGYYTGGLVTRQRYFETCLACAAAPFLHPQEYGIRHV